jgi:uncharacterized membrane protein YeiH
LFELTEYIGIIAFAMSGFFIAVRNNLDLLGVLISTFLTALGGGLMRDMIVGRTPYTFTHDLPAIMIIIVMVLMILFKLHKKDSMENKPFFIVSDSIGLVSFSITGALIAIEYALNFTGILALSFITAVGGGIARDIIINQVPFIFKTGFYGTVSLLVGILVYFSNEYNLINIYSIFGIFVFCVSLRVIGFYKKWSVPILK